MNNLTRPKRLPRLKLGRKARRFQLGGHRTPKVLQGESNQLNVWAGKLGSTTEAKRMMTLAQKFPQASLPELVTMDWLNRNGYDYEFQVPIMGGRRVAGGAVLDFVVITGGQAIAWAVQGEYWHTRRNIRLRDQAQYERLLGQYVAGFRVHSIAQLWEDAIYHQRPMVFYQALAGISTR